MTQTTSCCADNQPTAKNASQEFLDAQQYSTKGLTKYEQIFGAGFISTGGILTTEQFFARPEMQQALSVEGEVLDIGCGIGGGDILLAKQFPLASVHGVDLSTNCIRVADSRLSLETAAISDRVKFEVADILTCPLSKEHYSMMYSRDVILHIFDKPLLFQRLFDATKTEGTLFITDYCQAEDAVFSSEQAGEATEPGTLAEWTQYVAGRGYTLYSVAKYAATLEAAGWKVEKAEDLTSWFREIMEIELGKVQASDCTLTDDEKTELTDGWNAKIKRIDAGFMKWGAFFARKL